MDDFYKEKALEYAHAFKEANLYRRGIVNQDDIEKIYVIYVRKSTKGIDKQERSVKDQIAECEDFAFRNNLKFLDVLEEKETAHKADKRPVFNTILDTIREGGSYNSILAWHPDRLARNMKEAGMVIDMLDEGQIVDLKFSSYTFVNDPSGKMALGIQFVLAKNYSDNVGVNTQRGSDRTVAEGKSMGKRKHGYDIAEDKFYRPNEYYETIRKSWDMVLEGKPLRLVQDYLDENYRRLGHSTVSRIYSDPFFTGLFVHGDNVIDLLTVDKKFKPMVSYQEFVIARNILKQKAAFDPSRDNIENLLFKKMIKCGYCDHFMTPARSRNKYGDYYYYINCVNEYCETRKKNSRLKKSIRGKIIVDYIIEVLSRKLDITEQVYNDCVNDYSSMRGNQLELMDGSMQIIKEKINNLKISISELSLSIHSSTPKAAESIRGQIRSKSEELANKEVELEQLEDQKITLDAQVNAKIIPYKNFLNFFEKSEQEIRTNTDVYLLDQLVRNIFLNFSVKNGKVLSHELKEPFATYERLGVFNMG